MDLSYQEKSILGSLLSMVVVYGYYFSRALNDIGRADFASRTIGRLIFTVVAIVVIEIVYHIVLALETGVEPKDERDVLIERKAYRNAYLSLATGAWLMITYAIAAGLLSDTAQSILTPFLTVNLLLLAMVAAELTKLLTQLFYYRRGF